MIGSRNIRKSVFTGEINNGIITMDVRIEQMRHGWKGFILPYGFFFRFPHTLVKNDSAGWLHNTNSVNNLILIHNKCGVQNGRTQHSTVQRINKTRGQRLR